jgi:hypothetical protein
VKLAAQIHDRETAVLIPIGFEREGDEWRRGGEVPQVLRVQTGLTSRLEVKFFLQIRIDAKPRGIILQLPRLPTGTGWLSAEQGYVFRAGDSEQDFYRSVEQDIKGYVQPWFARFTSLNEMQRGFADGRSSRTRRWAIMLSCSRQIPHIPSRSCFEQVHDKMFVVFQDSDRVRIERFKQFTREKLRGVRCPDHHQAPRLQFHGITLHEITISLSGCCARLMEVANARIATASPVTLAPESGPLLHETTPRASTG